MFKTVFSVFFKVLFALGVVFAALAALRYFSDQKGDYIEIYNDEDECMEDLY